MLLKSFFDRSQMLGQCSDSFQQLGDLDVDLLQTNQRLQLNIHAWSGV
jgi:hypothetical protein